MEYYKNAYVGLVWLSYIFIGAGLLGVSTFAPHYFSFVQTAIQLYVAMYLLYIRTRSKDAFDKRVLMDSAILLFLTSALAGYLRTKVSLTGHLSHGLSFTRPSS
jgi:hypothetical protein